MSVPDREPSARTFDHARQDARRLLRACRAADPAALARVRAHLPRLAALAPAEAAAAVKLADVQHALAREAGEENWAALKHRFESEAPPAERARRFVHAMLEGDAGTMRRLAGGLRELARGSIHLACAACDAESVTALLAKDPALATTPLHENAWRPLECLAASPVFAFTPGFAAASVAIAHALLAAGADANTSSPGGGDPATPLTALYRASERGNAPLVRLLLERGADPNDSESVAHAAEHGHLEVLGLLLAHGAEVSAADPRWNVTPLYFLCGHRDTHPDRAQHLAGMTWLLEHGADPNVPSGREAETPFHRVAVGRRDAELTDLLLTHGADPRRARADGRTPWELARRSGNRVVAERLASLGATVAALRPDDAFLAACADGDLETVRRTAAEQPGLVREVIASEPEALMHAVRAGDATALRTLVAAGFDPGREGRWAGTPLHWSAWHGDLASVRALLELGAPLDVRDREYGSSPLAWAAHGSHHARSAPEDDYLAIVDLLLAAGSSREATYNKWGEPPEALCTDAVAELLRERGFAPPE